jgi:hypothetical protein
MGSMLPFALPGRWFKGCLHVHSTASDGERTVPEVLDWYRQRGYHFLALTDHDVLSQGRAFDADFLILGGIEVGGTDPVTGLYHLVGLGLQRTPQIAARAALPLQEAIDRLRAAGGRVVLAHPYWSGQRSANLLDVAGCLGLEVYNGGCDVEDAKGFSTVHWDDLLAAGRRWWGLAVDDAHWRYGDRDAGLGWVWVKARALAPEAIFDALEQGHFYASSGPEIYDLALEGDQVAVRCSPAVAVDFVGEGWFSRRVSAPAGERLTEASHRLRAGQRYVRVAVRDAAGCWAWSNPLFLDAWRKAS